MAHLRSLGVDFKQRQVDDQGLYQLFMFDPNGVKIELLEREGRGRGPARRDLLASELPD
jgi:hypothetical protein